MKVSDAKINSSGVHLQKKANVPFFNKQAGESFFSKSNDTSNNFFIPPSIQTKLSIGHPNDVYEKEADAMADKVVQRQAQPEVKTQREHAIQTKPFSTSFTPFVQTKCAHCEEEDKLQKKEKEVDKSLNGKLQKKPIFESNVKPTDDDKNIQRKCAECEKEEKLQKKSDTSSQTEPSNIEGKLNTSKGSGSSLPAATREHMENSFEADFSNVRIHNDNSAVQMSKNLNAQAFTHGSDIYFNSGKYDTNSKGGKHLLAHELTHVVQQNGIGTKKLKSQKEPLIQNKPNLISRNFVQCVHSEGGRKKFDCPDFSGDPKLEACLNDEDRLSPFATGASVISVQKGLQKDNSDLGVDGTSGVYGADTGKAVMAFKQKHRLGFTQFPDVGPGTMAKLDELCLSKPQPKKPKPPKPEPVDPCGPGTDNPFCLPLPATKGPCKPFANINEAEAVHNNLSTLIPLLTATFTHCGEVKPVWETYFATTSTPFAFDNTSSCVVNGAKTDPEGSDVANRAANGHLQDILDNLPISLRGITPSPFPLPGRPIAERRLSLEDAIGSHGPFFLHPPIVYNDPFNAAANIAGAVGVSGAGSDIFGDDDRVIGGSVIIEVTSIDPISGVMIGQVRWQPHIHVKDTVDFCPGNLGNSAQRQFTLPMSKLEAMGLTRDVPITIDYDLDVRQANFSVLPLIGPLSGGP
jgi:peptidoglycan hydrolase-like protein with peptidoglycan-binding domain